MSIANSSNNSCKPGNRDVVHRAILGLVVKRKQVVNTSGEPNKVQYMAQ
jgi:hypothetical protein